MLPRELKAATDRCVATEALPLRLPLVEAWLLLRIHCSRSRSTLLYFMYCAQHSSTRTKERRGTAPWVSARAGMCCHVRADDACAATGARMAPRCDLHHGAGVQPARHQLLLEQQPRLLALQPFTVTDAGTRTWVWPAASAKDGSSSPAN